MILIDFFMKRKILTYSFLEEHVTALQNQSIQPVLSIHEKLECTSDQTAIGNCIALFINNAYVELLFPEN